MIPLVCPRSISVIVGKRVDSPSASSASCWWREWIGIHPSRFVRQHSWCVRQKCQGHLAELDPPALGWEWLLPSVQLGSLHALVFQLFAQRGDSPNMVMPVLVENHKGGLAAGPQHPASCRNTTSCNWFDLQEPALERLLAVQISRPGAPSRGDVRQHVTSFFWMRCDCARACHHGLPCIEMVMRLGRQVHGLSYKAVLVVVLVAGFRRCSGALLKERRSYDIWGDLELSIYRRSPGGTIEAKKTCMVEPDQGKWVVKLAFGIVKHGGVTPINLGKSRPLP
ncbi:unnamed protein product [Prunus armeniaca]